MCYKVFEVVPLSVWTKPRFQHQPGNQRGKYPSWHVVPWGQGLDLPSSCELSLIRVCGCSEGKNLSPSFSVERGSEKPPPRRWRAQEPWSPVKNVTAMSEKIVWGSPPLDPVSAWVSAPDSALRSTSSLVQWQLGVPPRWLGDYIVVMELRTSEDIYRHGVNPLYFNWGLHRRKETYSRPHIQVREDPRQEFLNPIKGTFQYVVTEQAC